MNIPKTWREAKELGYRRTDSKYERGYVSRKIYEDDAKICVAGGNRKGELFYRRAAFNSTQYCVRQYITE